MNQTKSIKSNWCPAPGVRASAVSPGDGSLIQTLRLGTLGPGSPETFLTTHGSAHQSQPCCWVVGFYNLLEVRWDCAAASDSHPSQRCRFGFSSPCWPTVQDSEGCLFPEEQPWAQSRQSWDSGSYLPFSSVNVTGLMFRVKIYLRFMPDTFEQLLLLRIIL